MTKPLTPKMIKLLGWLCEAPNQLPDERTAKALERRGLIESCQIPFGRRGGSVYGWRLTDTGRAALVA